MKVLSAPTDTMAGTVRVVVGVTVSATTGDLSRCLRSIVEQDDPRWPVGVVLLIDVAGGGACPPLAVPQALAERTWVVQARCGSAALARNAVLDFVDNHLALVRWVARLDWDDRFRGPDLLSAVVEGAERSKASWALAGNRVVSRRGEVLRDNPVLETFARTEGVMAVLAAMAEGTADNELPSCNLLLRARCGARYPHRRSAEDHWLVAGLLLCQAQLGHLAVATLLCDYTLEGAGTSDAREAGIHLQSRRELYLAATWWAEVSALPGVVLGHGAEGVVRSVDDRVHKHFYPFALSTPEAELLERLAAIAPCVPTARLRPDAVGPEESWVADYAWEATSPFDAVDREAVTAFLGECLEAGIVCANVKRANFRRTAAGKLLYIDLGTSIRPMDVSWFRDSAARLYAIGVLAYGDEELVRRASDPEVPEVWHTLPGFDAFLGEVYTRHLHRHHQAKSGGGHRVRRAHHEVTLLLKVCPMDAAVAEGQARHIVDQLGAAVVFRERVLLVDPYEGPYVRQHTEGDLPALRCVAERLLADGVVDRVLEAPLAERDVLAVNRRWFDLEIPEARTPLGVPVAPQLWGFEQITTRYLLQCDIDVLIGRRVPQHDYLTEMLEACQPADVLGVAFNIPHPSQPAFRPYQADPGCFVPEVRCGLLDLERMRACCPLPNHDVDGRPGLTWYRSLQAHQEAHGLRTLRGGHHATFYVHPLNDQKADAAGLERVRDLVAQGVTPREQLRRWDVVGPLTLWRHPRRHEDIVVVARGRHTPLARVRRFVTGLVMQADQGFGVVVIDDASTEGSSAALADDLSVLGDRLTLIRHAARRGAMPNQLLAVREICAHPESLVVIVDLDDALLDRRVIGWLREARGRGHDVILGAPFRPDRPTQVYAPDFERLEETFGGDVWIHLRSYRKRLLDQVPDAELQLDGEWLERCNDYATMLAVVRRATAPVYVPRPMILHERTVKTTEAERSGQDEVILRLLRPGR